MKPLEGADRLPPIPPERWTAAQRREAEAMIAGPRGAVLAPFVPLLRSPELAGHVQRIGEYLRYRSAIGVRLTELAILITSKHYTQPVEWTIHAPIAEREGIAATTIAAIERGERPSGMPDDEALVHDICVELLQGHGQVGEALWGRAVARFGEPAVVDLVATCGYYGLLALVMNSARTRL
ncbi:MAG: carboxymuconolactone decarboxylase family protein [Pseudomonadota bacterium]